jgi:hypothetical protein
MLERISQLLLLTAFALCAPFACAEVVPGERYEIGDPCRSPYLFCYDDASVQRCEDHAWAVASCETVCAERGPAWIADGCDDEEACVCVLVDAHGCTPGESACADEASVSVCSELQTWETTACAEPCAAMQLESLGCLPASETEPAACWCTAESTPCPADAAPSCVDSSTLARCVDGLWAFEDCAATCPATGQCNPWGATASCECG